MSRLIIIILVLLGIAFLVFGALKSKAPEPVTTPKVEESTETLVPNRAVDSSDSSTKPSTSESSSIDSEIDNLDKEFDGLVIDDL